jgi:hypothetical protein
VYNNLTVPQHPSAKTTTVLKLFLLSFGTFLLAFLHHSAKVCSLLLGIQDWKPSSDNTRNQKSLAKTQDVEWSHPLDHKGALVGFRV